MKSGLYPYLRFALQLVEDKATPTKFLDASNRFYTLIPHDFGMNKPPLLDTSEAIKVCRTKICKSGFMVISKRFTIFLISRIFYHKIRFKMVVISHWKIGDYASSTDHRIS